MATELFSILQTTTRFSMAMPFTALAGALMLSLAAPTARAQSNQLPDLHFGDASRQGGKQVTQAKPQLKSVAATPTPAVPAGADTTVLETTRFTNWTVTCQSQTAQPRRCSAVTAVLRSKEDPRPILFAAIIKQNDAWRITLQVPTTTMVKPGVRLALGNETARQFEITSCEPTLCTAEGSLEAGTVEQFKGATNATATWTTINEGDAKVEFTLEGIAPAIAYLEKR